MKPLLLLPVAVLFYFFCGNRCIAQLQITPSNIAADLAQKISGPGVTISNAVLTGGANAKGFFVNQGNLTRIGLDSGIVLTSGRVKTAGNQIGLDGNGTNPAFQLNANTAYNLPGDMSLANAIGMQLANTRDACVLEFDFIPMGDTISFNYVFSSEEYQPSFVCQYNDAFAFFISGPGITGLKNIALVPGTNTPVSILNVNDVKNPPATLCPNNTKYYIDNSQNRYFTHEGHTVVLTAASAVQPCQTYHLKLVVMDVGDDMYDSGVFLEAGSLRSDPLQINNNIRLNESNLPYLAEGCSDGAIHITRSSRKPYPQTFGLQFAGTAINGVDVTTIPSSATIPANDSVVIISFSAIADMIPESNETLKIYVLNSCSSSFADSIEVEIRDIDMLATTPNDSVRICRDGAVQLEAESGFTTYAWSNGTTLSDPAISDPIATPLTGSVNYVCTAKRGNCEARDSILVQWKSILLHDKTDIQCSGGVSGSITVTPVGWDGAVSYALDNGSFQPGNSFTGLAAGTYQVKVQDASACIDSIQVTLLQLSNSLPVATSITAASCSLAPDGEIAVSIPGGSGAYTYSSNGTSYQGNNILVVPEGTYTVYVKDDNGCITTSPGIVVPKINDLIIDAEPDLYICEGTSHTIQATTNLAASFAWSPATSLSSTSVLTPATSTTQTTKYYVTASFGTCTYTDSVIINVRPAPVANAGMDVTICYGITATLSGSGGQTYQWANDPTFVSATDISNPVVKPGITTSYYLDVTDIHGCHSLQSSVVKIIVTPSVTIFAGRDTVVAINQPLQLNATDNSNSGVRNWEWTGAIHFFDDPFAASPLAVFTSPVTSAPYEYIYTVTGTTQSGCQGSDEIKVKVYQGPEIYVPSAFTPNNDGKNDVLMAFPVGIKELKYFRVFNRWGQMLFHTSSSSRGWDGLAGGIQQAPGVFIWIAEGTDYMGNPVSRKGTVTLIR